MELSSESIKSTEIKKHVSAIHCTNNLTLVQRKLLNALLYNAYYDLKDKTEFKIPIRSLCELIGYKSNDYKGLKKSLIGLMKTVVEWNVIDSSSKQNEDWSASTAVASVNFHDGICIYEYSKLMRELLHTPSIYGRLDMRVLSKFSSSYGIALYENCMRYQDLHLKQTRWFSLNVFRRLMGVVDDNKYKDLRNLKNRVIKIAVEDFNRQTLIPYTVVPEMQRDMGDILIRFKLLPKRDFSSVEKIANEELENLLLNNIGCSPELIKSFYEKYDLEYIAEKVKVITTSSSYLSGKVKNLAGFLIEALEKNYKPSKTSKEVIETTRSQQEQKEKLAKLEEQKREKNQREYGKYLKLRIDLLLENLAEEVKMQLFDEFGAHLEKQSVSLYADLFKKCGLQDRDVIGQFVNFIKPKKEEYAEFFMSLDAFLSTQKSSVLI